MTSNQSPARVELLPCPFCGGSNLKSRSRPARFNREKTTHPVHSIICHDCKARGPAANYAAYSATAWNRRSPSQAIPREPSEAMIDAGAATPKMKIINGYVSTAQLRGGFVDDSLSGPISDCAIAQCWKAMFDAAPKEGV